MRLYKILFSLFFIFPLSLVATDPELERCMQHVDYIFCVDGGGSKTELVVLDSAGNKLMLQNDENVSPCDSVKSSSSNLATLTKEQLEDSFETLFKGLLVGDNLIDAKQLFPTSAFIGGFAGAANPINPEALPEILQSFGFDKAHIAILSDAAIALELITLDGGILIAGTGSICFIKEAGEPFRVGGLGYRIADEGSGYDIGLKGIRAAIEHDYQYGEQTTLRDRVVDFYEVESPKKLIAPINHNQESPKSISSFAKIVFDEAWKGDPVSYHILEDAADHLARLTRQGLEQVHLKNPPLYLIGGVFKNEHSEKFIHMMIQSKHLDDLDLLRKPRYINISKSMVTELVVQKILQENQKLNGNF